MSTAFKGSLIERVRAGYAGLSPAERRVADMVLEFPGRVASYTATELAEAANVSKMTVSRLVRRLGFESYDDARMSARMVGDWGSPQFLLGRGLPHSGSTNPQGHMLAAINSINETLRLNSPEMLDSAVAALAGARSVWLYGVRNNAAFASYARWQFIQVRERVHLLAGLGETLGESLCDLGPDDLLMVLGIRRRTPAIVRLIETAAQRSIPILLVADAHSQLECRPPALTILCATRSNAALDGHAAVLAVLHALAAGLIDAAGAQGRRRIEQIEALHADLGEI